MGGLSLWSATRFEDVNEQGSKLPIVLDCFRDTATGTRETQFVKVEQYPKFSKSHLICEVVGASLAGGMGVFVAQPCVVSISHDVAQGVNRLLKARNVPLTVSQGHAAGAEYLHGVQSVDPGFNLGSRLHAEGSRLYAFDLFARNYDRLPENPNCGLLNNRLFAFDFEQCFHHLSEPTDSLGDNRHPWMVSNAWERTNHIFYRELQQKGIDEQSVRVSLRKWTDSWWESETSELYEPWRTFANQIWKEAVATRENEDAFIFQLKAGLE